MPIVRGCFGVALGATESVCKVKDSYSLALDRQSLPISDLTRLATKPDPIACESLWTCYLSRLVQIVVCSQAEILHLITGLP